MASYQEQGSPTYETEADPSSHRAQYKRKKLAKDKVSKHDAIYSKQFTVNNLPPILLDISCCQKIFAEQNFHGSSFQQANLLWMAEF